MALQTGNDTTRAHIFHAHANILTPTRDLGSQAFIDLPENGGFRSHFLDGYRSSDGVSFKSAYMHVAGTRSSKEGYGWVTLATAVVTGLNVHDVVKADLIFSQVSTEHPLEGYVPSVTFLGSRFENLRIAGGEVEPVLDLGICGPKPEGDRPYLQDSGFLNRVAQQRESIASLPGFRDSARERYHDSLNLTQSDKVECSLITRVDGAKPGTAYGHIVEVPGFGRISLGRLTVSNAFHLAMVYIEPDGPGIQPLTVPSSGGNGTTKP